MKSPVLTDLELFLVEAPATENTPPVRTVIFHLISDLGAEGWGEAHLAWRATELAARREMLLNILAGRSAFDLEELSDLSSLKPAALRCAVEMACWDLIGRFLGQPLCRLLGGEYRHYIPLAVRLPADSSHLAQTALELLHQGFHSQILTSSGNPELDSEAIRLITELTHGRISLRLDGGGQFDWDTARHLCELLEDLGLEYLIDPLREYELAQAALLARQTELKIAAWRSVNSATDVIGILKTGGTRALVIELPRTGGILPARYAAVVARAGGLEVSLASGPTLGISAAAMLHLAAANPVFTGCCECGYFSVRDDVLTQPLERSQGLARVPIEPGLGVVVDRNKLESLQIA